MNNLTDRQFEVLGYIKQYIKENSFPPSVRDIARNFHFTVKAAFDHLKAIEKKGAISRKTNTPRAIKIKNFIFADVPGESSAQVRYDETERLLDDLRR